MIIETLMKVTGKDPENYHDSKMLMDEFNQSWSPEEEHTESSTKDDLQISPVAPTTRDTGLLASPISPATIPPSSEKLKKVLASPSTPLNKAVVRPVYYTTGKVGATVLWLNAKSYFFYFRCFNHFLQSRINSDSHLPFH